MPSMKDLLASSGLAVLGGESKPAPVVHAVPKKPVTNAVTNTIPVTNAKSPRKVVGEVGASARVLRWRAENPEKYKATQRALMKKRRAKTASGVQA